MKQILFVLGLVFLVISCKTEIENNMTVSGNIKGLKKGTLLLQQFKDSTLVVLDSLKIEGDGAFSFSHKVENPEVFYLYLKKNDHNDINDRITFFGEMGEITINTAWNTFDTNAEVKGSTSHEKFMEFNTMVSKFNIRELEYLQVFRDTLLQKKPLVIDSVQRLIDQNIVRRYQYMLNFGLNNGDSYVTPYVMLTHAGGVNPKYLDSVHKSLSPEVADSEYGKAFKAFLEK